MIRIYHALPGGYRHILADPVIEGCEAWDVELTSQENHTGQLTLTIGNDNPEFLGLIPMRSEIIVMRDEMEYWRGRVIRTEMPKSWQKKLICKGTLDYLHDALLMPQTLSGSAEAVVASVLEQFNPESHKRFSIGSVSGIGSVEHEINKPTKVFTVLSDLAKEYGGSIFTRRDGDNNLFDWLSEDKRPICSQKAEYGANVSSLKLSSDGEKITTVLYGFGKNDITFASVNAGHSYITDSNALAQFGHIEDFISFPKITDPQELLDATKKELADRLSKVSTIEASILDLSWIDDSVEPFSAGHLVPLVAQNYGIDEVIPIKKIVCPLFRPSETKIELGTSIKAASALIGKNI